MSSAEISGISSENLTAKTKRVLARVNVVATEWTWIVPLLLVLGFIVFAPSTAPTDGSSKLRLQGSNNLLRQLILGSGFALAWLGMLSQGGALLKRSYRQKLMLTLLGFALLSTLWSDAPTLVLKRWVQFAGMLAVGWCALGAPDPARKMLRAIRWIFSAALIVSLLSVFMRHGYAFDATGAWQGIQSHKNSLGQVAVTVLVLWLPLLPHRTLSFSRITAVVMIALSVIAAIGSQSASAQAAMFIVFTLGAFLGTPMRWQLKLCFAPIPLLIFGLWYFNFQTEPMGELLSRLLGRDDTLTGRTLLWPYIWNSFQNNWLLGVGYNSFWLGTNSHAMLVTTEIGWDATQAHNGYLDILNELGIIGGVLFLLVLVEALVRTHRFFHVNRTIGTMLYLLLASQIVLNLTESGFGRGTSPGWFLFLVIYALVSMPPARVSALREDSEAGPPTA